MLYCCAVWAPVPYCAVRAPENGAVYCSAGAGMVITAALLTHYALLVSLMSSPMSWCALAMRSSSLLLVGWSSPAAPGVGLLVVRSL